MSANLFTKNGHSMYEISSLIQKAIRRGDEEFACYAASEMEWSYRAYLWKRLFVTSAEDCYDLITNDVLKLRQADDVRKDNANLSKAVSLLVATRKNRDADFFACNLLYSRYKKDYPCGGEVQTRHGHDVEKLATCLKEALLRCDDVEVGYLANEIRLWYRGLFWVCVKDVAGKLNYQPLTEEVLALEDVDMMQQKNFANGTTIYISKAITSIFKFIKYGQDVFKQTKYKLFNIDDYQDRRIIPEYTFDCHTLIGKRKGLTDDDFLISEQKCLKPHQQGEYDDRDWANSRKWRTEGRGNVFEIPKMPKELYNQINKGIFQPSLF